MVRRRAQGVVVCLIGSGVGASIIANGAALRGSTASAGRVGAHHRHDGRPHLPVRGARVPGGLCRCQAILDQCGGPLLGSDQEAAFTALIDLAHLAAVGGDAGQDRTVPGCQRRGPDQLVQP
jgi:hypothetical protein